MTYSCADDVRPHGAQQELNVDDSQLSFEDETAVRPASEPGIRPPSEAAVDTSLCPNCGHKLTNPLGLGWCQKCGYCRSLEEDKARVPLQQAQSQRRKPSPFGLLEFFQMVAMFPSWSWVLIGGVLTVAAVNVPPAYLLADGSLGRALWTSLHICMGLVLIIAAQTLALCRLAPNDDRLGFKDAILPGRLWALVGQNLPAMRVHLWMASWGLACMLSALFIVGGLGHWLTYLPKPPPPPVVEQPVE